MPLASTFLLLGRCPGETHMGINKETCSECSMHHRSVKAKNKKQKCIKQRVKKKLSSQFSQSFLLLLIPLVNIHLAFSSNVCVTTLKKKILLFYPSGIYLVVRVEMKVKRNFFSKHLVSCPRSIILNK